jgi:acyl-CoA thioester hydrolase
LSAVGGLLDLAARRLVPDPRERFRQLATDLEPLNL